MMWSSMAWYRSSITSSASIDLLGHVQVAVEERLRAGGDGLRGERAQPDQVAADLVELVLQRLAGFRLGARPPVSPFMRAIMTVGAGEGSADRAALASSLPAVHLRRVPGGGSAVPFGAGATGWTSRVHLDVTAGTVAGQTGSLPCQPMNEIERTIDVTTDRSTRMIRSRARWVVALVLCLRPRGRGVRLGFVNDRLRGVAMERRSSTKPAPAARSGDARRVRSHVPPGVLRDGDLGVQDGPARGHGDLRRRRLGQGPDRPAGRVWSSGPAPTAR